MRILIHMLPEQGHMSPSYPLARALVKRGHEIIYASILDFEAEVRAQGFGFLPFHPDVFVRGWRQWTESLSSATYEQAARIWRARSHENYLSGRVEDWVREAAPDVVISDVVTYGMTLVAHRMGLPCLRLAVTLSQRLDELPPLTSRLSLDTPHLVLEAARRCSSVLSVRTDAGWIDDVFCTRFGYPSRLASYDGVFALDLALYPEAVLCASPFDLPRRGETAPKYLAVPPDLERTEHVPPELASFLDPERPLIYAALGSQSGRLAWTSKVQAAFLDCLRVRPDWQGVLAMGPGRAVGVASGVPNAFLVDRAPQLWLLKRARAFVTHAGLGSVREAIAFRVPMLAVPQANDGFGNAARIRHHGIGVALTPDILDAEYLTTEVASMLASASMYEGRLAALDIECRQEEAQQRGSALLEGMLASRDGARASVESRASVSTHHDSQWGWLLLDPARGVRGGGAVAEGLQLTWPSSASLRLGAEGFTVCRDLPSALSCAEGNHLMRVEVSGEVLCSAPYLVGRRLRCHSLIEVGNVLRLYATWCAGLALDADLADEPRVAEWCRSMMLQCAPDSSQDAGCTSRNQSRTPDRPSEAEALATRIRMFSERAAVIFLEALDPRAWDAARFTRWRAARTITRQAVSSMAGTAVGAEIYEREEPVIYQRLDSELVRRLDAEVAACRA